VQKAQLQAQVQEEKTKMVQGKPRTDEENSLQLGTQLKMPIPGIETNVILFFAVSRLGIRFFSYDFRPGYSYNY